MGLAIAGIYPASGGEGLGVALAGLRPTPKALSELIFKVPPFKVVPPPYVFTPVKVNVPALDFVREPVAPEITPELVRLNVFVSTVSV